jgi:hypothetical protein
MIQGKWFAPGSDLSDVIPVRRAVFGRGADDCDALSWNALVFEDSVPVAAGRIWWEDGAYRLGDIGVLKDRRSRRLRPSSAASGASDCRARATSVLRWFRWGSKPIYSMNYAIPVEGLNNR